MRVRNIGVRDRNAVLLHRRNVRERYSGWHPVKPGKADMSGWILNHVPVQVHQRTAWADLRGDVFVAEEAHESRVASRLVGERIRHSCIRSGTQSIVLRTWGRYPHQIGKH